MQVIVYRNDEIPAKGELFVDLREAMERIKGRAQSEGKTVKDYSMMPIIEQEV